jgi:hypothetical protein
MFFFGAKMKLIPLTQGKFAKVDDNMFDYLNQWRWYYRSGYAVRMSHTENGRRGTIWLHREVVNAPANKQVDHIDLDKLNDQSVNLRTCTHAENQHNGPKRTTNKSGYKGVCWVKAKQKWVAQIEMNGRGRTIGAFSDPVNAAKAYDKVARDLFGEFAKTNFSL